MNDEQLKQVLAMLVRKGFDSTADQLRARDTVQREAIKAWKAAQAREAAALAHAWEQRDAAQAQLARVQAEMPALRANMTKALDLLDVLTSTKYTDRAFVEAVDEADEMLEQLRGKVVLKGMAEQQDARGALHEEAVRKDAERYRWLRNPGQDVALVLDKKTGHVPVDERGFGGYGIYEYRAGTELDEAVDAAMRAQGDGGADHA